jgi:uncharacterized membrane protein YwaF
MSANKLFRTAGWCALAGAIAMIAAMVFFMIAPLVGGILEYISLLLLVFVFCALYVAHRAESKWLSLAGLILLIAAIGADVFSMANYGNSTLGNLWYLLFSFPFLIYGFLSFRNARMPRGLAVVALLAGLILFVSGVIGLLGNPDLSDNVSTFAFLLILVWEVWLWRVFLSKKFTTISIETAAA